MTEPRTGAGPTPLPRRRGGGVVEATAPTPPPAPEPVRAGRHRAAGPVVEEPVLEAPAPVAPVLETPVPQAAVPEAAVPGVVPGPPPAAPAAPVIAPPAPRPAAPAPRPAAPAAERRDAPAPTGDFYGPATSRATFNPGNASPFHVPRTEAVPRRVGRHPVKTLTTWAAVLVALAIGAKYGYPVVMEQVHRKEIAAVTADLTTIGAAQEAYLKVNGAYATSVDTLGVPATVSRITVVSATGSGYCLEGDSVAGGIVRYSSPARGITETPCG